MPETCVTRNVVKIAVTFQRCGSQREGCWAVLRTTRRALRSIGRVVRTADICHGQRSEEAARTTAQSNSTLDGCADECARRHCSKTGPKSRLTKVIRESAVNR